MKVIAATTNTSNSKFMTTAPRITAAGAKVTETLTYETSTSSTPTEPEPEPKPETDTYMAQLGPMRISLHMARAEPPLPLDAASASLSSSTIAAPRNPPTNTGRSFAFSAPYRFHDPRTGVQTAFLESTGRLHIKDGAGSLEIWEHARYFMVDCMRQNPGKSPDELLKQLTGIFGPPQKVVPKGEIDYTQGRPRNKSSSSSLSGHSSSSHLAGPTGPLSTNQPPSDADEELSSDSGDDNDMAKANKKAAAAGGAGKVRMLGAPKSKGATPARHKSATKKADASPSGPPKDCGCGCGQQCGSPKSTFLPGHDARFHGWIKKYSKGLMKLSEFNETVQRYIRSHGIKKEE